MNPTTNDHIARAELNIQSDAASVWNALTDPDIISQYMFGTKVESDWKPGSRITWKGEWEGKPFEDHGVIEIFEPNTKLQYTHQTPAEAGFRHTVTIELDEDHGSTHLLLLQDQNKDEKAKAESEKNWNMMLDGMKKLLES